MKVGPDTVDLTARQRDVLDVLLRDDTIPTARQIGAELGISPRTIEHYCACLRLKLGCATTADVVLMFMRIELARLRRENAQLREQVDHDHRAAEDEDDRDDSQGQLFYL